MDGFADRTGLTSRHPERRYLWTDAFAVCNFLGLARATGDSRHAELALRLVDRVHHALGRHRGDDGRTGWLSGLPEHAGAAHPTRGGLRIGKLRPERRADEPVDERLEWERDGQYFHYLTKWMHALDQVAGSTGQPWFNRWARELAHAAYRAFRVVPRAGGPPRLVWKMSIDLSRVLVPSMGQHDPLDGFVTCAQLRASAVRGGGPPEGPELAEEVAALAAMAAGSDWVTADPLGLGGLLADACRVAQIGGPDAGAVGAVLPSLLSAALDGIGPYARQGDLRQPASRRLAFRELGLAVGLHGLDIVRRRAPDQQPLVDAIASFGGLGASIEAIRIDPAQHSAAPWREHRDINEVMLATSLVPDGFLTVPTPG
jgi:hypothetical protein